MRLRLALFSFLFMVYVDTAFCAEAQSSLDSTSSSSIGGLKESEGTTSPDRPCCEVIEIKEKGIIRVKESETGRTFNVQLDNMVLLQQVRVGQPLYVDFKTGAVSLYGAGKNSSRAWEGAGLEPFVDVYVGRTWTPKADVQLTSPFGNAHANDVTFDSSLVGGMRVGAWMPSVPYLGLAVDGFYFTTGVEPQTLTGCIGSSCGSLPTTAETKQKHIGIAFDIMLRMPIAKSEEFPMGRFQPYITFGPAVFRSKAEVPGFNSVWTTTLGFKGGAGGKVFVTNNLSLFGEYRLTWFEPEYQFFVSNTQISVSNRLTTHHFVGGLSVHF